ncbi:ankyrin repeat-containing domain protein [Kalaharituber pfeilii]|nr:ankyrin repeat-containing domain protein [Kalaharituber pfeilii]
MTCLETLMIEALSVHEDGTSAALLGLAARAAALLLERGGGMVDVNATAVETGNLELDLRRDTIWKRSIDACQSPLETAICQDNLEMVQLLLDQLPERPVPGGDRGTGAAQRTAVEGAHLEPRLGHHQASYWPSPVWTRTPLTGASTWAGRRTTGKHRCQSRPRRTTTRSSRYSLPCQAWTRRLWTRNGDTPLLQPEKPNHGGFTPLVAVCGAGLSSCDSTETPGTQIACLRLLLQLAPNVNLRFRDCAGMTPLMWAARENNVAAMELLRQHALSRSQDLAIDEGSGGSDGVYSALVYAALLNQVDSVKWLLRHGADPNAKDGAGNGVFQLELAKLNRRHLHRPSSKVKILRLLLSAGVDPYAVDHEGVSPLVGFRTTNSNRHALLAMQEWVRP